MTKLVVRRRKGEAIRIGRDVLITVVEVSPYSCQLVIDAPPEVAVLRLEAKRKEAP